MSILVVGSVAFDTLKTPFGERTKILGGAATYFSLSASYFTQVRVVGVVGEDFTAEHEAVLTSRGIDVRGIERASGNTFHWGGEYGENVNEAQTKFTDLNVFENFVPKIPDAYEDSKYLFLANIQPELQLDVRRKMPRVALVGGDTMNLWIDIKRAELLETLQQVDILLINDGEAKLLASDHSLVRSAKKILTMGPRALVIKHGEYGATIFFGDGSHPFRAPALPIAEVHDPTGAGDSFAGGFVGYLAKAGRVDDATIRKAVIYGSVMASFNVEDFSLNRLKGLSPAAIKQRYREFKHLTHFEVDEEF